MKKAKPKKTINLTKWEKQLQAEIKAGNWVEVPWSEAKKYHEWAIANAKRKTISLRISEGDLQALKARAAKKGKKYQTYIGEILHREAMKAA